MHLCASITACVCTCLCVCLCMSVCAHLCVHTCISTSACECMSVCVAPCSCVCPSVCACLCSCMCWYVLISGCLYQCVCWCVSMCVCVCVGCLLVKGCYPVVPYLSRNQQCHLREITEQIKVKPVVRCNPTFPLQKPNHSPPISHCPALELCWTLGGPGRENQNPF